MGNWQRRHIWVAVALGVCMIAVWLSLTTTVNNAQDYSLQCIDSGRGNDLLNVKAILQKSESDLRNGQDVGIAEADRGVIETAVSVFSVPLGISTPSTTSVPKCPHPTALSIEQTPGFQSSLAPSVSTPTPTATPSASATPILAFNDLPLKDQISTVEPFVNSVDNDIQTLHNTAWPFVLLILFGVLLALLSSYFATSLINRLLTRNWYKKLNANEQELIDQFKGILQKLSFDSIYAILNRNILGEDLKQDVASLEKHYRTHHQEEEMDWYMASRILYKVGYVCRAESAKMSEREVYDAYQIVQKIISLGLRKQLVRLADTLTFFLALWLILNSGIPLTLSAVSKSSALLGGFMEPWLHFVELLGGGILLIVISMPILEYGIRWFTEKTWSDFDDLLVGVIGGPLIVVVIAVIISLSISQVPDYFIYYVRIGWNIANQTKWSQSLVTLLIGWLAIFLLNKVIVYALLRWSERTEQKYDDMFVRIIQVFGTFILIAIDLGVLLTNFQEDITKLTGVDNILLPYSIIVSVFSAVLGYASRDAIENFFGGIMLQVDAPFRVGERLDLGEGQICDVRELGMRSTTLYNISENNEISVPNSEMAKKTIKNLSRPDRSFRSISKAIVPYNPTDIQKLESTLMDIAYLEGEVDEMRVAEEEIGTHQHALGRRSVIEELKSLERSHPQILGAVTSQIEGGGKFSERLIFPELYERLERVFRLRKEYEQVYSEAQNELKNIIATVSQYSDKHYLEQFTDLVREVDLRIYLLYLNGKEKEKIDPFSEEDEKKIENLIVDFGFRNKDVNIIKGKLLELGNQNVKYIDEELKKRAEKSYGDKIGYMGIKARTERWEKERLRKVSQIAAETSIIGELTLAIATSLPAIRPDMDRLFTELNKEPVVISTSLALQEQHFKEIQLGYYAMHTERKDIVSHKVNKAIRRRMFRAGVVPVSQEELVDWQERA